MDYHSDSTNCQYRKGMVVTQVIFFSASHSMLDESTSNNRNCTKDVNSIQNFLCYVRKKDTILQLCSAVAGCSDLFNFGTIIITSDRTAYLRDILFYKSGLKLITFSYYINRKNHSLKYKNYSLD